jgi:hypothetical protein
MNTTISETGMWGASWQTEVNMMNAVRSSPPARSDKEIRESYNATVSDAYKDFIKTAAAFHDNEQCFGEEVAREAFATRNAIKEAHQAETSWLGQAVILVRNVFMYGAGNATYESLSRKKNPEEIAYAAFKTDGGDLGLNGNGLGDVLDTWKAIKDICTIYPEKITPAMVEAFKSQLPGKVDPALILAAASPDVLKSEPVSLSDLMAEMGGAPSRRYQRI